MRILHVVRSDGWAGVERHVAALAAEQAAGGHDVQVIGGDRTLVPLRLGADVGFEPADTVLQVVRALHTVPVPSVINVHMTAAEVAAALSLRMRGVPVVSTRHFSAVRGTRWVSRPVVRGAAHRIAAQISVSQHVADHIDGASSVVHSGVPVRPDAEPATARRPVVLMAQRLEPEKDADVAVAGFAASGLPARGWTLEVAGDGSLRGRLEQQVHDLGLDHAVRFLGRRSDVQELMDTASILLAPGPDESFGLSVLEAMASGLPTVASGAGGHLETIGSLADARLFPAGDAATAGRLLAGLADDPDARDAYARSLQDAQRARFTIEAQARGTEAVYRSVL